jgi:hypothetical protein
VFPSHEGNKEKQTWGNTTAHKRSEAMRGPIDKMTTEDCKKKLKIRKNTTEDKRSEAMRGPIDKMTTEDRSVIKCLSPMYG